MLTKNISFQTFKEKKKNSKIKKNFISLLKEENEVIKSLGLFYKNNYPKKKIRNLKKN